jgi:amino acid adenylation domain-containing protein
MFNRRKMQVTDVPRLAESITGHSDSIWARIASQAFATPDRIAITDGAVGLTFSELELRSNRLAEHLREAGVDAEACVGLFLERSADFVVAALAVMKAGGAYLPLDSATPADRARSILADAGAVLLLTHRRKAGGLNVACRTIEIDTLPATNTRDALSRQDDVPEDPDALAYVIYTSGSTGRPKGVEITHGNLLNLIDWHQHAFSVTAADRASEVAGLGFDAAGWEIWPHLTAGASVHFADEATRRSPQALRDWIVAEKITISFVPTVLAEQLLHSEWPSTTALRTLLTGADTLHRRPITGLPFAVINNYGPTECTVVATSGKVLADGAEGRPSIGRPISNTTALILDDQLRPVPRGDAGELCLAGAHVGRGYRNNPEMTASRFVTYAPSSGPSLRIYRTGDRARFTEAGDIAFLGRLDDQVKIRGYRIELGEIVASLDRFLGLEASAVIARNDPVAGQQLVAYVVLGPAAKVTSVDLREFLAARLPDYMIPATFVAVDALPITANGKLDKAALPAPTAENIVPKGDAPAHSSAPSSDIEERVAKLVASLLGHASVTREENFFMAGGHSMLGVQLVARIRDTFGVKLHLRQLFGAPTIAALSAEVEKLSASGAIKTM